MCDFGKLGLDGVVRYGNQVELMNICYLYQVISRTTKGFARLLF